jgi:uncharacterized protein (DUF4415 family)
MSRKKRNPERASRDNPVWTDETFKRARPAKEVLPKVFGGAVAKEMLRPRGRPKSGNARVAISLRLPPEILARWKATGPGWQTRMAERLKRVG